MMPSQRWWALLAVGIPAALLACGATSSREIAPHTAVWGTVREGATFVVLGDVQRTSKLEFWREDNTPERRTILEAVANVGANLVVFTGDLVFDGGGEDHWTEFDALSAPIRARGVSATTAFGNHEYWAGRASAERNVFARFPALSQRHWSTFMVGPVRMVVLDSNQDALTPAEWETQRTFLADTLAAADHDDATRGVLVLLHHPPFTNSTVTGDEEHVKRAFLPSFARSQKTLAMLAGHVHSYERFRSGGKMFVVSGGGGGPRAKLATGPDRRHPDDLFDGPALRDFHFTIYTVNETGLSAEVRGLAKGSHDTYAMDRFELPFASARR
jgi:hypothetical protein